MIANASNNAPRIQRTCGRRAVTLLELLLATMIMTMLAAALGAMASAVYRSNEYGNGYGTVTQHARVVMDRINNNVAHAIANETYPGVVVLEETLAGYSFPDTLVVWRPTMAAVDPTGKPRVNELVVYRFNPSAPNELLELNDPGNSAQSPDISDATAWRTTVDAMLTSTTAVKTVLTDLLRVATVKEASAATRGRDRGCIRFELALHPSAAEWTSYKAGTTAWADLQWPQSIYGATSGLRQSWVRYELQFKPPVVSTEKTNDDAFPPAPFFGSAALYYDLGR